MLARALNKLTSMQTISSQEDTIVAIATGSTPGAIGILRLSGPESLSIVSRCLKSSKALPARRMSLQTLYDPETAVLLDTVMVCYFAAPHSYTGQEMVEIHAHGGVLNLTKILELMLREGARLARAGEYTQRAFLNQKLDLSQAEAVMDVINAQTELALREAHRQLSGSISAPVAQLREALLRVMVMLEACIDFSSEENLVSLPDQEVGATLRWVLDQIERMIRAHESFRMQGYRVVLLGKPNAGKSSLFNLMLGQERAIVTPISGTTTDSLEARLHMGDVSITLIDTAGITQAKDLIEELGVQRSMQEAEGADFVLWLCDACERPALPEQMCQLLNGYAARERLLVVLNKMDLAPGPMDAQRSAIMELLPGLSKAQIFEISSVTRSGVQALEAALKTQIGTQERELEGQSVVTSQRHIVLLRGAMESLSRAAQALGAGLAAECIAADVREACDDLGQITGAIATDDVLNAIFSQFCIGK